MMHGQNHIKSTRSLVSINQQVPYIWSYEHRVLKVHVNEKTHLKQKIPHWH